MYKPGGGGDEEGETEDMMLEQDTGDFWDEDIDMRDVCLLYLGDEPDNYMMIFDSANTKVSKADKSV